MVKKKPILKPKKYRCTSCGMVFFKFTKKGTEEIICPYCESELYHTLITK